MTTKLPGLEWASAACTLPTADRPLRLAEFDDLFATALLRVEREALTRARFTLTDSGGLRETVEDLTARESACCSFFLFTLSGSGPDGLILDAEVPAAQVDVLSALVVRARAAVAA